MLELFAVSGLINAITALTFGILVIAKNWRERSNRVFFIMTLALAVWGVGYWYWLSAPTYADALIWLRTLLIGSLFIPILFFHWISLTLDRERKHIYILWAAYSIALLITVTSYTNTGLLISGLHPKHLWLFVFKYRGAAISIFALQQGSQRKMDFGMQHGFAKC